MHKRNFLKSAAGGCLLAASPRWTFSPSKAAASATHKVFSRVRPGDPGWPSEAKWNGLNKAVHGRLVKVSSPPGGLSSNSWRRRLQGTLHCTTQSLLHQR
jgi:hypothetical protein